MKCKYYSPKYHGNRISFSGDHSDSILKIRAEHAEQKVRINELEKLLVQNGIEMIREGNEYVE